MIRLRRLLMPPVFPDDEKTRVARLLHRVLLAAAIINSVDAMLLAVFAPETLPTFWINGLILLCTIVPFLLLVRGKVYAAALLLLLGAWGAITVNLVIDGGLNSPAFGFLSLIIIAGAVLLGAWGALLFGGISFITVLYLQVAAVNGWLPTLESPPTPSRIFATQTAIFVGLTALMAISSRSVEKALRRAYRGEAELVERNQQLQDEIARREKAEQERLEMAVQKERLDSFKEFLSTISHDLKTPLAVIKTSLYILERVDDPQRQKEKIDQIQQQTVLVEKYVQDVLVLSSLDHMPVFTLARVDVNALLRQIEKLLKPAAEVKQLRFGFQLDAGLPAIMAGEQELYQALNNLIENAVHYTPPEGSITIQTGVQGKGVFIRVADTGIGIPADDLPRIFQRFYRSEAAQKMRYGGTGLGLVIVRRIVDIHCGKIDVESLPGQGTTFRLWLPLTPADGITESPPVALPSDRDSRPGP